jgi:hypothetical protein
MKINPIGNRKEKGNIIIGLIKAIAFLAWLLIN